MNAEIWETLSATGRAYRREELPSIPMTPNATELRDALAPLRAYLKGWNADRLRGVTPAEARRYLKQVQEVDATLFEVERALEARTVVSRALR
jgi:hypothetical protein